MRGARIALGLALVAAALYLLLGRGDEEPADRPPAAENAADGDPVGHVPGLAGRDAPRPRVDTAAEEAQEAPPDAGLVITGRAVDETRHPLPGTRVLVDVNKEPVTEATAAADGTFTLSLGVQPADLATCRMRLRHEHRGADRAMLLRPGLRSPLRYGAIVLRPLRRLAVRVERAGVVVTGADVALRDMQDDTGSPLALARTDGQGETHFDGLAAGKVGVFAVAAGTGRAFQEVALPHEEPVVIELPDDRSATIHVRRADTKAPVPGAEVFLSGDGTMPFPRGRGLLPPPPDLRTDAAGNATVSGLPPGWVRVVARAEGLALPGMGFMPGRVALKPDDKEVSVELHPYRAVRFPIQGEVPSPGTTLSVRRYQPMPGYDVGYPEARIEDGHLVLEPFPPSFDWGHVATADGRWALWRAPQEANVGEAVRFLPVYDLRVKLMWRNGNPAVGQLVDARIEPRGHAGPVRTDEEGLALLPRLIGESAYVTWTTVAGGRGHALAQVSLKTDPGTIEFEIGRPIEVAVQVFVDGVPRLPADYGLTVADTSPGARPGRMRGVSSAEITEDADEAELRFRTQPASDGSAPAVALRAEGLPEATATPARDDAGLWRARLDLTSGTALQVQVAPPEHGRYMLVVERWSTEHERWIWLHDDPVYQKGRRGTEGRYVFRGFPPGRYRVRDFYADIASDPFDLATGGAPLEVTLDLTNSVVVRGRVEVPEGEQVAYATVRVEGRDQGLVSRSNPTRVAADGAFEFRAVRGERLRLVVDHPILTARGGAASFVVDREAPVLRLERGPEILFRVAGSTFTTAEPDPRVSPVYFGPLHVRMAPAGSWSPDVPQRTPVAKDGLYRLRVPKPGTWTLRIEQQGFVPHLVEAVTIGETSRDLGTVRLSKGATLTVRLRKGKTALPRWLAVIATRQGDLPYMASGHAVEPGDPPHVLVPGLGPGRFEVVVHRMYEQAGVLATVVVESDGETPLSIDVTLP